MMYTEHDKLTVIELEKETDNLSFQQIGMVLKERPANVIYCELGGKMYGVISMGDVERAKFLGKSEVKVNRVFTSAGPNEYMKVRQIFKERENINAVPVIDENRRLLGNYTRWDDLLILEHRNFLADNQYIADFWKENNYVALVKPCTIFPRKKYLFEEWESGLKHLGVRVEVIDQMSVSQYLDKVKWVIFADEDEKRGGCTLIGRIFDDESIWDNWYKITTYKAIGNIVENEKIKNSAIESTFQAIGAGGGQKNHILVLHTRNNGSEYFRRLMKEISQKFIDADILVRAGVPIGSMLPVSARKGFFDELYTEEYAEAIIHHPYEVESSGFANRLCDISSKYHNVKGGERITVGQPDEYDRTIWFFGSCLILGLYVEDKYTIESFLQLTCNNIGIRCKVVNLGICDTTWGILDAIVHAPIKKNDIIVVNFRYNEKVDSVDNLYLVDALEDNNVQGDWFIDNFRHCNHRVNKIYADAIFKRLQPMLKESVNTLNEPLNISGDAAVSSYAEHYCKYYFANLPLNSTIGSIVMNCNPFTNGHRYLIEEALKIVDFLIIFVVEENKSIFTFDERFSLVNAGVADLQNVAVVPSGELILSQKTFPEYFFKVEDEYLGQNIEYDIMLFAEQIAPRLNIAYRFVGEEPQDRVTNEYNQVMKKILPVNGIKVVEIPRKENKDGIISASRVRKCLEENNFAELAKLIPKSTLEILGLQAE